MIIFAPLLLIILAGAFALGLTLLIENTLHRKDIVLDDIVFFIEGNGVRAARIDLIKYNKYHTMYRAVPNAGEKIIFFAEDVGDKIFCSKREAEKYIKR